MPKPPAAPPTEDQSEPDAAPHSETESHQRIPAQFLDPKAVWTRLAPDNAQIHLVAEFDEHAVGYALTPPEAFHLSKELMQAVFRYLNSADTD